MFLELFEVQSEFGDKLLCCVGSVTLNLNQKKALNEASCQMFTSEKQSSTTYKAFRFVRVHCDWLKISVAIDFK